MRYTPAATAVDTTSTVAMHLPNTYITDDSFEFLNVNYRSLSQEALTFYNIYIIFLNDLLVKQHILLKKKYIILSKCYRII